MPPSKSIYLWKVGVAAIELLVVCYLASLAYSLGWHGALITLGLLCFASVLEGSLAYGRFRNSTEAYDQAAYKKELDRYDQEQFWLSKLLRYIGVGVVFILLTEAMFRILFPSWQFGLIGAIYAVIYYSKFYVRASSPPLPSQMKPSITWTP